MRGECDGCGAFADVVAVFEGDDPSTGYVGSDEPQYLCWECRHPFAELIRAAEHRANRTAMLLLGVDPKQEAEVTSAPTDKSQLLSSNEVGARSCKRSDTVAPEPFEQLSLEEKLVASIAIANYRKESVA